MKPSVMILLNNYKKTSSILIQMPTYYPSKGLSMMKILGPSILPIQKPSNKPSNVQ